MIMSDNTNNEAVVPDEVSSEEIEIETADGVDVGGVEDVDIDMDSLEVASFDDLEEVEQDVEYVVVSVKGVNKKLGIGGIPFPHYSNILSQYELENAKRPRIANQNLMIGMIAASVVDPKLDDTQREKLKGIVRGWPSGPVMQIMSVISGSHGMDITNIDESMRAAEGFFVPEDPTAGS